VSEGALDEEAVIKAGSKSFAAASALFDRQTREDAWRLYAWCRYCDDVIDGQVLGHGMKPVDGAEDRLAELRRATLLATQGDEPVPPEFEALRVVARRHGIPASLAQSLIDGFAMDVEARRYRSLEDTLVYAYHVAGVVGVMMAMVMGARDRPTLERACDLGIALQLTNIARDVVEDARNGRVYLPEAWLEEAGLAPDADTVAAQASRQAVAQVTARLLDVADGYYRSATLGIGRLPLRSAWAIAAARDVYRDIGLIVRRRGAKAWDRRASASKARKLVLLGRGGLVALASRLPTKPAPRTGLWTMPDL
jgi:phytoene synthase